MSLQPSYAILYFQDLCFGPTKEKGVSSKQCNEYGNIVILRLQWVKVHHIY